MKIRLSILSIAFLLLGVGSARADSVTVQADPSPVCVSPGACSLITVTLTNTSGVPAEVVHFNIQAVSTGDVFSLEFTLDQLQELAALDGEMAPGTSKVLHFSVCLEANAPDDSSGEIQITFTVTSADETEEVSERIQAKAIPEPASMFLLGTGLAGVMLKARKKLKDRHMKRRFDR